MPTEKQLANLKMIPPGKSGNPKGRPKGRVSPTAELIKLLKRRMTFKDPITKEDVQRSGTSWIAYRLFTKAMAGDTRAMQEILDRVEGKVKQEFAGDVVTHQGQPEYDYDDPETVELIKRLHERRAKLAEDCES